MKETDPSAYFSKLNYTLANEDTRLELAIAQTKKPKSILSICGSGGRFLPLAASEPQKIVALDLAPQQLALAELRRATILRLEFENYLRFWGFPPYDVNKENSFRRDIFQKLELSSSSLAYFANLFESCGWQGLIYTGHWESSIISMNTFTRRFAKGHYDEIFSITDMSEQKKFFDSKMASFWWKSVPRLVFRLVGNATFFNYLIYRGHFVKKNVSESHYTYYRNAFVKNCENGLARENFFLQLFMLGRIVYPEGNPIEAQMPTYKLMRDALTTTTKISLEKSDLISFAKTTTEKFDFVSLSDVPSYFSGEMEQTYMRDLSRALNPGALVVARFYLRVPENTDLTGYSDATSDYAGMIDAEKTQMYKIFVYQYRG